MTSTAFSVRRTERYVYNSLHWVFPLPVFTAVLFRGQAPMHWWLSWLLVAAVACWSGLVVLHTRLRDADLLPPSRWDAARTVHLRAYLWLWVGAGLLTCADAAWVISSAPFERVALSIVIGGALAMPLLTWTSVRPELVVGVGIVLAQPSLWLGPLPNGGFGVRVAMVWWSAFGTAGLLGLAVMFRNVLVTTRELEKARQGAARWAVTEERLRFSRDLHDVFGRTLSAIALKAELAAEQAHRGRPEAVKTMREVQQIATSALSEVREVVRGYRESDLSSEIAGAASLLEASGVVVSTVTQGEAVLPAPVGRAFGWVVREGATNLLRHSDATVARIDVTSEPELARLVMSNDRPRAAAAGDDAGGFGLEGLAERLAEAGGRLDVRHEAEAFTLIAEVDADALARLREAAAEPEGVPTNALTPGKEAMIRVIVADDEHLIREALAALLELAGDIEVVGQAASGDEALALARRARPHVAVLDLQMPGLSGTEVAAALASESPETGCVIVTSHGLPGHLKQALARGVRGFVPKTISGVRLAEVIRTVHAGVRYVDPELAADAIAAGDSPLTPREADVLHAAEGGAPVEEIAARVHLSPGTVRNYLSSAIGKLQAATRHEAVSIARARGWI